MRLFWEVWAGPRSLTLFKGPEREGACVSPGNCPMRGGRRSRLHLAARCCRNIRTIHAQSPYWSALSGPVKTAQAGAFPTSPPPPREYLASAVQSFPRAMAAFSCTEAFWTSLTVSFSRILTTSVSSSLVAVPGTSRHLPRQ